MLAPSQRVLASPAVPFAVFPFWFFILIHGPSGSIVLNADLGAEAGSPGDPGGTTTVPGVEPRGTEEGRQRDQVGKWRYRDGENAVLGFPVWSCDVVKIHTAFPSRGGSVW
jgi:hypothetical protein